MMLSSFNTYIFLLLVIAFLVMLAHRLKISYPIVLVIGGLLLSFVPGLKVIEISPELVFTIFLPPLLYEAAWQTSWKDFYKWRRIILSFAFIIVLVTSCVIAFVSSNIIPGFTLGLGFLLGGIISPPDAVSATSIMKDITVPKRLSSIIEGESLLNDASSIIVFRFALAAVITGQFVFAKAAGDFFVVVIMGTVLGLAVALIFYAIHRWLPTTPTVDLLLTFVAPYVMYIVAERFHFSGVLAVVSGGLLLSGNRQTMLSHASRIQGFSVWNILGFVLNGLIFILIGLQLRVIVNGLEGISLPAAIRYSLIISAVLIVSRLICALGASVFTMAVSPFITTADNRPGWREPLVLGWAGMRGVVSLAAALSIPLYLTDHKPFPQRNLILFITFTVILITLVFQGLTLPALIRILRLREKDYPVPLTEQQQKLRRKMASAGLQLLNEKYADRINENNLLKDLQIKLKNEINLLDTLKKDESTTEGLQPVEEYNAAVTEILEEQRRLLQEINKKAEIDETVVRDHLLALDQEEALLRRQVESQ